MTLDLSIQQLPGEQKPTPIRADRHVDACLFCVSATTHHFRGLAYKGTGVTTKVCAWVSATGFCGTAVQHTCHKVPRLLWVATLTAQAMQR